MSTSLTLNQEQVQELWIIVTERLHHLQIEQKTHTDPVIRQIIERQRVRAQSILEVIEGRKV